TRPFSTLSRRMMIYRNIAERASLGSTCTQMPNIRPNMRVHAVVSAILLCIALGLVAMTRTEQVGARLFFGVFDIVITFALIYEYRKETILAHDHAIVAGTVTNILPGRRGGRRIKYRFVALNGLQYRGESDYWRRLPMGVGSDVVLLYRPLEPTVNQPVQQFLFYSFQSYGSQ